MIGMGRFAPPTPSLQDPALPRPLNSAPAPVQCSFLWPSAKRMLRATTPMPDGVDPSHLNSWTRLHLGVHLVRSRSPSPPRSPRASTAQLTSEGYITSSNDAEVNWRMEKELEKERRYWVNKVALTKTRLAVVKRNQTSPQARRAGPASC